MVQRDQIVVELYRQGWEASRHPWNLLLSFMSLYVFVGVAVIAYLARTESGQAFPFLLFILSGFALIGILWTLRTEDISDRWNRAQLEIQNSFGIREPANGNAIDNRSLWAKLFDVRRWLSNLRDTGIAFKSSYLFDLFVLVYGYRYRGNSVSYWNLKFQRVYVRGGSGTNCSTHFPI
jgi:prepilin signal peptidase PulO-like enzyme (type II secretory pathway)